MANLYAKVLQVVGFGMHYNVPSSDMTNIASSQFLVCIST